MALTPTVIDKWHDGQRIHCVFSLAASGNYATGGVALSFLNKVPTNKDPFHIELKGKAGYVYEYDYTAKKVIVRLGAGFTPAGTVAAPVFTGDALATHNHDMKIIGGQAAAATDTIFAPAATDLLGKQEAGDADILAADYATKGGVVPITAGTPAGTNSAPAFTGTAVAAAVLAELAAAAFPAGVTGDSIRGYAIFRLV